MKCTAKIVLLAVAGLLLLAALAGTAARKRSAQTILDQTRLALREQGFKLEALEFDFSVPVQDSARAFALDGFGKACYLPLAETIDFLPPVGTNAALMMWDQPKLVAGSCADLWAELRESLFNRCLSAPVGPLSLALTGHESQPRRAAA